jgi:hypothetical protein
MLLAAAKHIAQKAAFSGTVNLIFQPAEEGLGGAKKMMEDGLFTQFPCDAVFGMHNMPGHPRTFSRAVGLATTGSSKTPPRKAAPCVALTPCIVSSRPRPQAVAPNERSSGVVPSR